RRAACPGRAARGRRNLHLAARHRRARGRVLARGPGPGDPRPGAARAARHRGAAGATRMTPGPSSRAGPLLAVTDLAKAFGGVHAVDGVSFSVDTGRMLALIGPNGAGKSTCFNLVNGQLRPDRGQVRLDGADITGQPPRAIWRA